MGRAVLVTVLVFIAMWLVTGIVVSATGGDGSLSVPFIFVIGCAIWAAVDASAIEIKKYKTNLSGPGAIFFGTVLLWVIVFPWYLTVRGRVLSGDVELKPGEIIRPHSGNIATGNPPHTSLSQTSENETASDVLTQLERLGSLRDKGVLTEDEFNDQKRKMLSQ